MVESKIMAQFMYDGATFIIIACIATADAKTSDVAKNSVIKGGTTSGDLGVS